MHITWYKNCVWNASVLLRIFQIEYCSRYFQVFLGISRYFLYLSLIWLSFLCVCSTGYRCMDDHMSVVCISVSYRIRRRQRRCQEASETGRCPGTGKTNTPITSSTGIGTGRVSTRRWTRYTSTTGTTLISHRLVFRVFVQSRQYFSRHKLPRRQFIAATSNFHSFIRCWTGGKLSLFMECTAYINSSAMPSFACYTDVKRPVQIFIFKHSFFAWGEQLGYHQFMCTARSIADRYPHSKLRHVFCGQFIKRSLSPI